MGMVEDKVLLPLLGAFNARRYLLTYYICVLITAAIGIGPTVPAVITVALSPFPRYYRAIITVPTVLPQ